MYFCLQPRLPVELVYSTALYRVDPKRDVLDDLEYGFPSSRESESRRILKLPALFLRKSWTASHLTSAEQLSAEQLYRVNHEILR